MSPCFYKTLFPHIAVGLKAARRIVLWSSVAALSALWASPVSAQEEPEVEDVVWTGTEDNDFGNPTNWEPQRVPGFYDRAVFTEEATITIPDGSGITVAGLLFDSPDPVVIDGLSEDNLLGVNFRGEVVVLQGDHTITGSQPGGTSGGLRLVGIFERVFDMAEGTSLTLDVRVRHNGTGLDGDPLLGGEFASGETGINRLFLKRGGGTLVMTKDNGGSSSWNNTDNFFTVEEGVLRMTHRRATGFGGNNFRVVPGGTLEVSSGFQLSSGILSLGGPGVDGTGALRATGSGEVTDSGDRGISAVLNADTSIGADEGAALSFLRSIAEKDGRHQLTKVGEGTVRFDPEYGNTYTGGTVVAEGRAVAVTANALGAGPVSVQGGSLRLDAEPDLGVSGLDDFYGLVWYPSEGDATTSTLRIHRGFDGEELASTEWEGLFPDAASEGRDGLGDTYQLEAGGVYDDEGGLTLSFTLTDADGTSGSVSVELEESITGDLFGIGGVLESTDAREFDFLDFSVSLGDEPDAAESFPEVSPSFEAPFTLDFGTGSGQENGDNLFFQRAEDFEIQSDSLRYLATSGSLAPASARAAVSNYHAGQDFTIEADMILRTLEWPGENRVGIAVLGSAGEPNRIVLEGGELELGEGVRYAGVRAKSSIGAGTTAEFLDGTAEFDGTVIATDWSAGGGEASNILDLSILSPFDFLDPVAPALPVSGWLLEGDFSDAFDENEGTASGSPTFSNDVPEALEGGQSLVLDEGDYVDFGLPDNLRFTESFSASAWVKTTQDESNRYVLGNYNTSGGNRAWAMIINNGEFRVNLSTDGSFDTASTGIHHTSFDVNNGEWHHLAFTWDAGDLRLYVNGLEVTGADLVVSRSINFTTIVDPQDSSIVVGRRNKGGVSGSQLVGSVGQPALWDHALDADEIAWLSRNSLSGLQDNGGGEEPDDGFAPFVLSIEHASGLSTEAMEDLNVYFRENASSEFAPLGTDRVGLDAPWSESYRTVGQYGVDPSTGTVWVVTDRNLGGFVANTSAEVEVGDGYDAWADEEGIPAGERDPALDRFGRGIPNLVAYVTGISSSDPAEPLINAFLDNGLMRFQLPVRPEVEDADFFVSISTDLVEWNEVPEVDWESSSLDDGRLLMDGTLPVDPDAEGRRFFRIEFRLND